MSINIGSYTFDGPYKNATTLKDKSGIYAILSLNGVKTNIIEIGESSMVKTRIEGHFKDSSLHKQSKGFMMVAVCYTPNIQQAGRRQIQEEIKLHLKSI